MSLHQDGDHLEFTGDSETFLLSVSGDGDDPPIGLAKIELDMGMATKLLELCHDAIAMTKKYGDSACIQLLRGGPVWFEHLSLLSTICEDEEVPVLVDAVVNNGSIWLSPRSVDLFNFANGEPVDVGCVHVLASCFGVRWWGYYNNELLTTGWLRINDLQRVVHAD